MGRGLGWLLAVVLLLALLLPLASLFLATSPQALWNAIHDSAVRTSIGFTLLASGIALLFATVLGVPLGYLLARRPFPGRLIVESAVALPVAVPHLIAGLSLAILLAPGTPIGDLIDSLGFPVFGTIWGVVAVMVYVSAPYTVLASRIAFQRADSETLDAVRCLGATPSEAFATVTLPSAARGIGGGLVLTWARAVSEIGGFLILAYTVYPSSGYSGEVTSPISVYVYSLFQIGLVGGAETTSVLFLLIAFAIFLTARFAGGLGGLIGLTRESGE